MLFIPHAKREVGGDTAFSFDLTDGRAALCGLGVVLEAFTSAENRFARPGILIEIRQLQPDSRPVFEKMSAMPRAKRRATTQPSTAAPPPIGSMRTLAAIPSERPRAFTSAIEMVGTVSLASSAAPGIETPPLQEPPRRPAGSGAMFEEAVAATARGPAFAQSSGAILQGAEDVRAEARRAPRLVRRWNALSPSRRWLVAGGAGSIAVTLIVLIATSGSKTSSPRAPAPAARTSALFAGDDEAANATAAPAPAKKPPVVKKKKKRVATKRIAAKSATKQPIKKPAKRTSKLVVKKKPCSSLDCV